MPSSKRARQRITVLLFLALTPALAGLALLLDDVTAQQPAVPVGPSAVPAVSGGNLPAPGAGQAAGSAGADVPFGGTNEPAIAANPLNSMNIAAADLFSLRVSIDGGAIWSAATPESVPGTHVLCGDSSLAFDSAGRLFWTYLGCLATNYNFIDIFIAQVNPATGAVLAGYPFNVTASPGVNLPASSGNCHDKAWSAADRFAGSPFEDRLYITWAQFTGTSCGLPSVVKTAYSADQGLTWSAASTLSAGAEGFVWPAHAAVAPNGDAYVAYHSQPSILPDGTSGQVFVLRSTDGGVSYPQKTLAYTAGNADITFNIQGFPRMLNQNRSWTEGSDQAWVMPDPIAPNVVSVVAADDPTNSAHGGTNDDLAIYIVRSTDSGATWSAPVQVDSGPGSSHQFFPTAGFDSTSRCLTVAWYDTRAGATNGGGDFLLDVFVRSSSNGGVTFGPEVQINDVPFDPDLGAPDRFPPTGTLRIGEYIGVAVGGGVAHAVWTGNTVSGQQVFYDKTIACAAGDTDGDGCPDLKEQQTAIGSQTSGGRRDYLNPWDYFNPTHDGQNRVDDILVVAQHFGKNTGDPGYSTDYDRTSLGPNPWNLGPPNGQIRVNDILAAVYQYHHDCS
jgi:hypothetical protein